MLKIGGNQRLEKFFEKYDLQDNKAHRYGSHAAEYYRKLLKSECEESLFNLLPPSYDEGRKYQILTTVISNQTKKSALDKVMAKLSPSKK